MTDLPRPAQPGELCTCGRQATSVVVNPDGISVGICGMDNGGVPPGGVCVFCNNEISHDRERFDDQGFPAGVFKQGAVCPLYYLRPEPESS